MNTLELWKTFCTGFFHPLSAAMTWNSSAYLTLHLPCLFDISHSQTSLLSGEWSQTSQNSERKCSYDEVASLAPCYTSIAWSIAFPSSLMITAIFSWSEMKQQSWTWSRKPWHSCVGDTRQEVLAISSVTWVSLWTCSPISFFMHSSWSLRTRTPLSSEGLPGTLWIRHIHVEGEAIGQDWWATQL